MASSPIRLAQIIFRCKIEEYIYGVFYQLSKLKDGDLKPCCALVLVELSPERSKVFIYICLALLPSSST